MKDRAHPSPFSPFAFSDARPGSTVGRCLTLEPGSQDSWSGHILPFLLPPIQEVGLSVTGKGMCT